MFFRLPVLLISKLKVSFIFHKLLEQKCKFNTTGSFRSLKLKTTNKQNEKRNRVFVPFEKNFFLKSFESSFKIFFCFTSPVGIRNFIVVTSWSSKKFSLVLSYS